MLTKGVQHQCMPTSTCSLISAALMEARQCGYEILPHQSYSSDLTPSDFSFSQIKTPLKGRRFDDTDEVIQEVLGEAVLFNTIWRLLQ